MFTLQPPAGNCVNLLGATYKSDDLYEIFSPYKINLYGNGTSALAAAIQVAVKKQQNASPEIIIPAYACPDLISAANYAGCIPVLCDFQKDSTQLDIDCLEKSINKNTVAIITVNLFGIQQQVVALKAISNKYGIPLIEDSAQYLPKKIQQDSWFGDYIIISFGRGKPASILTGGAVLTKSNSNKVFSERLKRLNKIKYYLKVVIYNFLIQPYLYFYLDKIPALKLGQSKYTPLTEIDIFPKELTSILILNLYNYQFTQNQLIDIYSRIISKFNYIDDLFEREASHCETLPLRYPILIDSKTNRDKLFSFLKKNGVGVSKMYLKTLNEFSEAGKIIYQQPPSNAKDFADRLLTLPTHQGIGNKQITELSNYLIEFTKTYDLQ